MVGQTPLLSVIDKMIEDNSFPRFSIIQGADGSGKNLMAKYITNKLGAMSASMDNSVDSIRNAIKRAYEPTKQPLVFVFRHAEDMSQAARNALLKVTEEPPNNVYFILTVVNDNAIPDTLKSRAGVFHMLPYSNRDLSQYLFEKGKSDMRYADADKRKIALEICDTPGDIDVLMDNDPIKLYDFVEKVVDNIGTVSVSNALKITDSLALTDKDEGKFDLVLFLRAVIMWYCKDLKDSVTHMSTDDLHKMAKVVMSTKESINMITSVRGINKRNVFDIWVLEMRNILDGDEDGSF